MDSNMTKVMLVEDDKSLREIYGVRLQAEGYEIVSAGDGEEALAMAIKERPSLIVSDVMMPKISGFDMLDILRSTTETKDIKVIMMTALSSEEQRARGETLGADRYLVKSQVGIEDVVRVVHEVLADAPAAVAPVQAAVAPDTLMAPAAPAAPDSRTAAAPVVPQRPVAPVEAPPVATPAAVEQPVVEPVVTIPNPPVQPVEPAAPIENQQPTTPVAPNDPPRPASSTSRIIQPLSDPTTNPIDINQLLDKELAKEAGIDEDARPSVQTMDQERDALAAELANFEASRNTNPGDSTETESSQDSTSAPTPGSVPPPPPPTTVS